jgi:glycine/D-amino acid oxidase-like deaminating enzyme/nitrite reductase/ring-hydroxylating ferredoxin subunit
MPLRELVCPELNFTDIVPFLILSCYKKTIFYKEKGVEMANVPDRTSGENRSYWIDSTKPIKFSRLDTPLSTDVVIVGAGISGLTTAYLLSRSGRSVIVLDDGYVGSGETGRTTAHLVNALDDRYYELEGFFGRDGIKAAAESHTAAVDAIEQIVADEQIDCSFMRLDGYLFLHPTDEKENIHKEYTAAKNAGLNVQLVNDVPGISGIEFPALKFPGQAVFHPMKYLKGLSDAILKRGGRIFTETHVHDIEDDGVITKDKIKVNASHIVVATNTPFHRRFVMHTKQAPYRTYVIAARIRKGLIPYALWWDTGDHKSEWPAYPYHYVRMQPYDNEFDLLIAGGEDHKTGQPDEENISEQTRYVNLTEWTKMHFPFIEEVDYTWSGQVMEPVDDLGFIGKDPGSDNIFMITGDSGNGMTHGTLGGLIITDLINNIQNKWAHLYDPSRKTMKAADTFIEEQMNVAKKFLKYLTPGDIDSVKELDKDSGAVIRDGMSKAAVYRDANGKLHAFSAVCPHLKCIVEWNSDEKTFDCPCHGSRFSSLGKLINGPANHDLEERGIPEE